MLALLLSALLLLVNGFFVAAEFALIAARRSRIEQLADTGDRRAAAAIASIRELSFMLSAAQLGITIASLVLGYLAEPALADLLEGPLHDLGVGEGATHTIAFVVALTVVVFLHMVVGEMVPKNIAIAEPDRTALWLALPMRAFTQAFRPVVSLLNVSANGLLRLLGVEPTDELSEGRTGDEIARMLAVSRGAGLLEEVEHRLMTGALGFPVRDVASVMVRRDDVVAVPDSATVVEVERMAVASGHSRIVVQGRGPDEVLGFVHAKDLLGISPAARARRVPARLVREMLVVPATRSLQDLLLAMRRARIHVALVEAADGSTAGIVTLEDVLESLVGDIRDEHDRRTA